MLSLHPLRWDQVIKICRRTTLTEKQLREWCDEVRDVFTEEYSDESSEENDHEQTNVIFHQECLN